MKKVMAVVLVVAFAAVLGGCMCTKSEKPAAAPAAEKPAAAAPAK